MRAIVKAHLEQMEAQRLRYDELVQTNSDIMDKHSK
jgi:hypothetical protein